MKKRRYLIIASLLLLSACGFSPIYGAKEDGAGTPVAEALGNIAIASIPNEQGQNLRNKLLDRLSFHGRPQHPTAKLYVTITSAESELGIQKDATASLSELTLNASYRLEGKNKKKLVSGSAQSVVLYSKLDAQYGTLAAQRNAYERALTEVSEQIVNRLSLYYAEPPMPEMRSPKNSWAFSPREKK